DRAHQPADPHPRRLLDGVREADQGPLRREQDDHADSGRDHGCERECSGNSDPVAQAPHDRDLHRAGGADDERRSAKASVSLAPVTEPDAPRPVSPAELGFERIVYEKAPPRATITLNRPEVLNAFDFRMLRETARAW